MKKILSLSLVALMLISTLMLTSCESLPNEVLNFVPDFVYDWFPDLAKTTVTEEEWDAMFECSSFTVEMTMSFGENSMTATLFVADNGQKQIATQGEESETVWVVYESDGVYEITEEDGKYYGEKYTYEYTAPTLVDLVGEISMDDLTYDEASKSYKAEVDGASLEMKFRNGRIHYIKLKAEVDGLLVDYEITDFYKTVVKIPTYTKR